MKANASNRLQRAGIAALFFVVGAGYSLVAYDTNSTLARTMCALCAAVVLFRGGMWAYYAWTGGYPK